MSFRYVALGDGYEACEARLGGQEIVVRRIEAAKALCIGRTIADRQQPSLIVVEQAEVHAVGQRKSPLRKPFRVFWRDRVRLPGNLDVVIKAHRPVGDFGFVGVGGSRIERLTRSPQARRWTGKCREPVFDSPRADDDRSDDLKVCSEVPVLRSMLAVSIRHFERAPQQRNDFFETGKI